VNRFAVRFQAVRFVSGQGFSRAARFLNKKPLQPLWWGIGTAALKPDLGFAFPARLKPCPDTKPDFLA